MRWAAPTPQLENTFRRRLSGTRCSLNGIMFLIRTVFCVGWRFCFTFFLHLQLCAAQQCVLCLPFLLLPFFFSQNSLTLRFQRSRLAFIKWFILFYFYYYFIIHKMPATFWALVLFWLSLTHAIPRTLMGSHSFNFPLNKFYLRGIFFGAR